MSPEFKHKIIRNLFISAVFLLFAMMFWPFFTALLLAGLFAFALDNFAVKLTLKKIPRKYASLIVVLCVMLFIAAPLFFIVLKSISTVREYAAVGLQNTPFYQSTITLVHNLMDYVTQLASEMNLDLSKLPNPVQILNDNSGVIGGYATGMVARLPQLVLSLLVFFLGLYYFLIDSHKIKALFLKFDLLSEFELNKIIYIVKRSSHLTLIASLVIGCLQAFVVTLFAYFCGFTDFVIVFITTAIFTLIPVVGSAPVTLFLATICFIQGNNSAGIAMLVGLAIASSLDNVIRAYLMNSENKELHPILSLLTVIGAILIYGPIGILLGPVLTQLAFNIMPILSVEKSGETSGLIAYNEADKP